MRRFPDRGRNGSDRWELIPDADFRGRWHDLVVHIKWTESEDGFVRVWVNGKEKLNSQTLAARTPGAGKIYHKYGIYRIADTHYHPAVAHFSQLRRRITRAEVEVNPSLVAKMAANLPRIVASFKSSDPGAARS